MARPKTDIGVPQKTLDVSRARYHLTQLVRELRNGPRIYRITQSGKPAAALVNLEWLGTLLAQARGKQPFTLFGQATAAQDWEQTLIRLRQTHMVRTLGRHTAFSR